jgi:hypothetical protein
MTRAMSRSRQAAQGSVSELNFFGYSVALSGDGDTLAVGAAHVFAGLAAD